MTSTFVRKTRSTLLRWPTETRCTLVGVSAPSFCACVCSPIYVSTSMCVQMTECFVVFARPKRGQAEFEGAVCPMCIELANPPPVVSELPCYNGNSSTSRRPIVVTASVVLVYVWFTVGPQATAADRITSTVSSAYGYWSVCVRA